VVFDAGRPNYDRRRLEYRWDFDGDGTWDHPKTAKDAKAPSYTTAPDATFVYDKAGEYKIVLEVRDLRWHTTASSSAKLEVQGATTIKSTASERQRARRASAAVAITEVRR
jgi:PKD repeat protein